MKLDPPIRYFLYFSAAFLISVGSFVVISLWPEETPPPPDNMAVVDTNDDLYALAVSKARNQLDTLRKLAPLQRGKAFVRIQEQGTMPPQYTWLEVTEVTNEGFKVKYDGGQEIGMRIMSIDAKRVTDWQVYVQGDSIRGGYTAQYLLKKQLAQPGVDSQLVNDKLGTFLDPLKP